MLGGIELVVVAKQYIAAAVVVARSHIPTYVSGFLLSNRLHSANIVRSCCLLIIFCCCCVCSVCFGHFIIEFITRFYRIRLTIIIVLNIIAVLLSEYNSVFSSLEMDEWVTSCESII